ncbi:hypothetical protein FQZ97_802300 [compost metagenome]
MSTIYSYFEALDRLVNSKSFRVPNGSKISNDVVALEAGMPKGSIRASNSKHISLINAIKEAAIQQAESTPKNRKLSARITRLNRDASHYKEAYEQSLNREILLIQQIYSLQAEVSELKKSSSLRLVSDKP